jgi:hypothetical protein
LFELRVFNNIKEKEQNLGNPLIGNLSIKFKKPCSANSIASEQSLFALVATLIGAFNKSLREQSLKAIKLYKNYKNCKYV